jgi:hypothetical protein
MALSNIGVPHPGLKLPSSWGRRGDMVRLLTNGWTKYGGFFQQAAKTSNIPVEMLMAFAVVESNMNPNVQAGRVIAGQTKSTTGLMQWDRRPGYADKILTNEFKLGRMSEAEKAILKRKGVKWDTNGNFQPITQNQQLDPELNILIGSIYLGQYADSIYQGKKEPIEWGRDGDKLRLDRMITVYNTGGGEGVGAKARTKLYKTPLELAKAANDTTSAYIHKIMGVDGALDVLTKELKSVVS